jgi:hypothetical protein
LNYAAKVLLPPSIVGFESHGKGRRDLSARFGIFCHTEEGDRSVTVCFSFLSFSFFSFALITSIVIALATAGPAFPLKVLVALVVVHRIPARARAACIRMSHAV